MDKKLEAALKKAQDIAYRAAQDGEGGVIHCPNCNNETFVVDGSSSDGVIETGKCLYCDYERDEEAADDEAFDQMLDRHKDD